jgi:hypothetical protein
MRLTALAAMLLVPSALFSLDPAASSPASSNAVQGVVADSSGATVSGAEVDLVEATGVTAVTTHTDNSGSFLEVAPHPGSFTLVITAPGFATVTRPLTLAASKSAAPLSVRIVLPIASMATSVHVSADTNQDLTAGDENRDSSVMTSADLKALPIFDNDYASAMSAFLDDNVTATGGAGLLVDGVEADHATVSASAVQEVRINQDPYSAQYYWPGRGQMEIITKSAADHYHGQFNFLFRDSGMNAQNALAPTKPFEQRRVYEGHTTGPIPHFTKSSFLGSFNRAEEDKDSVVSATLAPTAENLTGALQANVPSPTRETDFSLRAAHQFGDRHSAYAQYSYEDWNGHNQGVGGQTLAAAGYFSEWHEDDVVLHVDSTLSASLFNQISIVAEHDSNRHANAFEAPQVSVSGDFTGGSAQSDSFGSEYNLRIYEMATWTRGRHLIKTGFGTPHISRRAYDDHNNELGTYTFAPTLAADGVTVLQTALQNYANSLPSAFSINSGDTHFIYHQQEMGAFIQDQYKISERLSITPGLRYDWQNFLATKRLAFSPRISFAWMLSEASKTMVRGGGGIYYDRFGSGPLLELERYGDARRRATILSLNPAALPSTGCVPITNCITLTAQPPALSQLASNARTPYQIQYGVSVERQLGEKATGVISGYSARGIGAFRSVDVNAPTPQSGYTERPDSNFGRVRQFQSSGFWEGNALDISYRGRFNKRFTGFGRYTWSHFESNQNGIWSFPQNQYAPNDEWSNSSWDRRHRLGMYAMFNPESVLNLSAGIFTNTGTPWTILTGTDAYGDGLFNTRPAGVGRNTRTNPGYTDVDLRWGHDFAFTANKAEDAPKLGFSASSFNVLNHVNGGGINPILTSSTFGQITSASAPRRIQLAMRLEF